MRLYELFDDSGMQPGLLKTLNDPAGLAGSATPSAQNAVASNNNSNIAASSNATANSAITTSPGNQPINPAITQQLTKGSTLNAMPVGPGKTPTNLKITNVANDPDKTITLANPQNPNAPGQAYKFKDLAQALADKQNIKV